MAISNINFKANVQENGTELKKQKGRLVIGIAGTHTLDDADILFGANESDAVDNSAKLEAAILKGGFNEIVFLAGRFYVHGGFSCNGRTIRGSSRNSAGYYDSSSNHATYIVNTEDWGDGGILSGDNCRICDLTITSTDTAYNSEEFTRVGFYCDYGENSVLENVTFEKIKGTAIHIYEGYGITVRNCIVKSDCGTGIYCSDGKYVTISDCDVSSSVSIDSHNQTENPVYVFSNKFNGDCTLYNCYAENNLIKGAFSGTDNFTTIGATKLTEDKVKALNEVGTTILYLPSGDRNTSGFYYPEVEALKPNATYIVEFYRYSVSGTVTEIIRFDDSGYTWTSSQGEIRIEYNFGEVSVYYSIGTHESATRPAVLRFTRIA